MRYIDADGFKERTMQIGIQQGKEEFAVFLCKYIDTVPTADVAREIFEEIDKAIKEHSQGYCCDWYLYELIAELKKKYIGADE